jgi:hypothetical protein
MLTLLTCAGFVSFLSYIWIPEEPGHTSDQKKAHGNFKSLFCNYFKKLLQYWFDPKF